ncbi:hypothetical protein [Frischella perrara]|uniref:hypothetical protein n=1 Tax=Frischella perrara TaxID=1267021 RepID=UPI001930E3DD|nr:hypothetical protein [Frischella perrara]MCT6876041.1 hypothetical protein [Frischella perrara]
MLRNNAVQALVLFFRHCLDWSDFLKNGIDAEILLKINDVMANQVIEQARRRYE